MITNEKKFNTELGQLIRKARLQQGLSQKNLADKLGITFQQMQKYETGGNGISSWRMNQITQILGISFALYINRALPDFPHRTLSTTEIHTAIKELQKRLLG